MSIRSLIAACFLVLATTAKAAEWQKLEGRPIDEAEHQFTAIQQNQNLIRSFYGSNILNTLDSKGERLPPQEIIRALRIPAYPAS